MSNLKDFTRIKQVGKGAFGVAWLVESKINSKKYVIKELGQKEMSEREKIDARKEVMLLAKMNHTNIVTYFNSFEEGGRVHILMEFCEHGDLGARIKAQNGVLFKEDQILDYFVQICHGIKHIHDSKILHRDIKPQNIFLTKDNIVKLGDFGIAKLMNSTTAFTSTTVGTPFYFSPELCSRRMYNNKSDIWSLGCVLYELCTLNHAFSAQEMAILALRIKNVSYKPISTNYTPALRLLIGSIFQRDPRERPNINDILKKPFIARVFEKNCNSQNVPRPVPAKEVAAVRPNPAPANRVNSGLNHRKVSNRENLNANSPYLPAAKKPMVKRQDNNKPSALVIKKNDLAKKGRAAMIINDRENAWKNILSSPNESKETSEKDAVSNEASDMPRIRPIGMYDNYYADLERIKQQQELRENEGKQLIHRFQRIQDDDPSDGVYRKLNPAKIGCDRDRVVMDFWENKQMAMFNRNRNGAGVAKAFGADRKIDQKVAPPPTPQRYDEEMAERLNKIRQQNAEERRNQNIGDCALNFDKDKGQIINRENARLALEDLQKKIKQRSEELHQKLALKRLEKEQENDQQKREENIVKPTIDFPVKPNNNIILFPKRADPFTPIPRVNVEMNKVPDHGMTNALDQLKNMKAPTEEVKVPFAEDGNMKAPSLSVVLNKLREEPATPRPTTAPAPMKTEITKIKTDILKRLNKNKVLLDKVEEVDQRKSWCLQFDYNLLKKDESVDDLDETVADTSTMVDVSVLSSDSEDRSPRQQWSMEGNQLCGMAKEAERQRPSWGQHKDVEIHMMTEVTEDTVKGDNSESTVYDTVSGDIGTEKSAMDVEVVPATGLVDEAREDEIEEIVPSVTETPSDDVITTPVLVTDSQTPIEAWQKKPIDHIVEAPNNQYLNAQGDGRSSTSSSSEDDDRNEVSLQMMKILEIKSSSSSEEEPDEYSTMIMSKHLIEDPIRVVTHVRSLPHMADIDKIFPKKAKSESDLISSFNGEDSSDNTGDEDFSDDKSNDENIFVKIEMIRAKLETEIGLDPLLDAVEFVRESQDLDGDHITARLREMLSNNEDAVNDIFHLVVLEEQYNNMD